MTNVLEAVAIAVTEGDSSPQRLARRVGYPPSVVRRALQHPELPWLVEQVAPTPLLTTSLERRLERLAGEALDVVQATMQGSASEALRVRCAGILLQAWQHAQRTGALPPAPPRELAPEVLDVLRESERRG